MASYIQQISGQPVTVFLSNGVKLQGVMYGVRPDAFLLDRDSVSQIVFRQCVATIMPADPFTFDCETYSLETE